MFTSKNIKKLTKLISSKDNVISKFFKEKSTKEIWDIKTKFFINKTM